MNAGLKRRKYGFPFIIGIESVVMFLFFLGIPAPLSSFLARVVFFLEYRIAGEYSRSTVFLLGSLG